MGYSCTTIASLTLNRLAEALQNATNPPVKSSNAWHSNGAEYFYEIGREQRDGAITGIVQKIVLYPELTPPERCHKVGSFRIDPDGKIVRFPTTTQSMRAQAEQAGKEEFDTRFAANGLAIGSNV